MGEMSSVTRSDYDFGTVRRESSSPLDTEDRIGFTKQVLRFFLFPTQENV